MAINVAVVGAAGFAGIEVLRLVLAHPEFSLVAATASDLAGTPVAEAYPSLEGVCDLSFVAHDDPILKTCDCLFLAVPHTASLAQAPGYVQEGKVVIDLSADFRLKDAKVYESWYGVSHGEPKLLADAAFGLPELFPEDLKRLAEDYNRGKGVLVACAGCYPTATSLAAAPLVRAGILRPGVVVADAISGVTGAGKKPSARTHFCFADENVEAYGVTSHRHTPEIEQILGLQDRVVFTPHLGPFKRGILSTVTMALAKALSPDELQTIYEDFYREASFVTVLPQGKQPRTASVAGSNYAQIAAMVDQRTQTVIATAAIDNLCKGAAGQAVQCANIVYGLPETCGLQTPALPV